MRNDLEERNKVYKMKLLMTGKEEHGFYTPTAQKPLPKNVIFCSVFVTFMMEEEHISRS
jgi:hypothetical protein